MPTHRVVSIDELSQYLHLPEKAVAKELGICLTSLKKLCRQNGITRWPYRKLKSLDKKIARAENGSGTTEDAETLKARAEELKKEKMAVAFTYGLKPGKESAEDTEKSGEASTPLSDRGTPPDFSDILSVEGMLVAEITKAVANPKKKGAPAGSPLSTTAAVIAKSAPHVFSTYANRDSPTSIPTPPDDGSIDTVGEGVDADMLAEAAEDVMASNALLEDTRMSSCISWEAPSLEDSLVEPAEDNIGDTPPDCNTPSSSAALQSVEDFPATASKKKVAKGNKSGEEKDGGDKSAKGAKGKNKCLVVVPKEAAAKAGGGVTKGGTQKGLPPVLDHEKLSALALVSSPRAAVAGGAQKGVGEMTDGCTVHLCLKDDELVETGGAARRPRFDLGEDEKDLSFGHDLMESEFFSAMDQVPPLRSRPPLPLSLS